MRTKQPHVIDEHPEGLEHPVVTKVANRAAKRAGSNKATRILVDPQLKSNIKVLKRVNPGYCKNSDDSPVSNSYVRICRGKGIYYRHAVCEVAVPSIIPPELQ